MAFSYSPFFPQALHSGVLQLVAANTTNTVNVIVSSTNGTKIESIIATSNDTIDHALTISMNIGGVNYLMANVNIPANSGSIVGTPPVNVLGNVAFSGLPSDPAGNRYIYVANNGSITVSSNSAISSNKVVNVIIQAADF